MRWRDGSQFPYVQFHLDITLLKTPHCFLIGIRSERQRYKEGTDEDPSDYHSGIVEHSLRLFSRACKLNLFWQAFYYLSRATSISDGPESEIQAPQTNSDNTNLHLQNGGQQSIDRL